MFVDVIVIYVKSQIVVLKPRILGSWLLLKVPVVVSQATVAYSNLDPVAYHSSPYPSLGFRISFRI
jgi:hypothetical protein